MFGASSFLRPQNNRNANDLGFDAAFLGLDKTNPFPPDTIDYKEYEWGWNEGMDLLAELSVNESTYQDWNDPW